MIKIIVSGFILHHHAYLRDPWSAIDFSIVVMSWLDYIPGLMGGNVQFLRMVRVLRPLRSMNKIQGMEVLISVLIEAMKPLLDVAALLLLVICIFGILGMNLFQGSLHSRCVWPGNGSVVGGLEQKPCAPFGYQCPESMPSFSSGNLSSSQSSSALFPVPVCVTNVTVFDNTNIFDGWIHFDHFGAAFLTVFQVITEENWSRISYMFGDAFNSTVSALFFCLADIIGSWFLLSFFIAVLADEYEVQKVKHKKEDEKRKARRHHVRKALKERLDGDKKQEIHPDLLDLESSSSRSHRSIAQSAGAESSIASRGAAAQVAIEVTAAEDLPTLCDEPPRLRSVTQQLCMKTRELCKKIVGHLCFSAAIMFFIVSNTVLMAMEHHSQPVFESNYVQKALVDCSESAAGWLVDSQGDPCDVLGMPSEWDRVLTDGNILICVVFAVEMALKLIALGPKAYFRSKFNVFDAFVMATSIFELLYYTFVKKASSNSAASIFRGFRMLRVFKLARSWSSLRRILLTVEQALNSFGPLAVVLILFIYVAALLGMQLFGGRVPRSPDDPNYVRANFDKLLMPGNLVQGEVSGGQGYGALFTVFQILTLEGWSNIMYTCLAGTSGIGAIYFFAVIILGQFIILNLFLTILLSGFADAGRDEKERRVHDVVDGSLGLRWLRKLPLLVASAWELRRSQSNAVAPIASAATNVESDERTASSKAPSAAKTMEPTGDGDSVFLRLCQRLVSHRAFEGLMLLCIALSSVLVAVQQPQWDETHPTYFAFRVCDAVFAAIFTLEMVLKCIAFGLVRGENPYLRDVWNWLDVVVVGISMFTLAFERYKSFRVMRAFRAIRPLRLVKRFPGMRLVVSCLLRSIPSMLEVSSVILLLYLIFAILGTSLFKGNFYHCVDLFPTHQLVDVPDIHGIRNWRDCKALNFSWQARDMSFDNVGLSMLTLFEVSTLSSWPATLNAAVDSGGTPAGLAPSFMQNPLCAPYFILFILVGTYFALNLFTGVVIQNYNDLQELAENEAVNEPGLLQELNKAQKGWVSVVKTAMRTKPRRAQRIPQSGWRRWLYNLCAHKFFEVSVVLCTIVNLAILASDHLNSTATYARVTTFINLFITAVFVVEMILKMTAFTPRGYFHDIWNTFDLILVLVSAVDAVITLVTTVTSDDNGGVDDAARSAFGALKVLRVFRVFRVLQILKRAKNLRRLLSTLAFSLPPLLNIFCLVLLMMAIYAILGQHLFWNVLAVDQGEIDYDNASFSNFFSAMFLLIRFRKCATPLCLLIASLSAQCSFSVAM